MLLDVRNSDGTYALDVNQIHHKPDALPYTALDLAEQLATKYPVADTRKTFELLKQSDAYHFSDIPTEGLSPNPRRLVSNEKEIPPSKLAAKTKTEIFNANPQNIHNAEVEETVTNSIRALQKSYGSVVDTKQALSEVRDYIEEQKNNAILKKSFDLIQKHAEAKHPTTGLSLNHVLSLVWEGAKDTKAIPVDQPNVVPEKFCNTRKQALLEQLIEIGNTYENDDESCISGVRNRIVASLNKAHPDVSITFTSGTAAHDAYDTARALEARMLLKYSRSHQLIILKTWPDLLLEKKSDSPAYQFHRDAKPFIAETLQKLYGAVARQDRLDMLTADEYYYDMPMPPVYPPLDHLLKNIGQMSDMKNPLHQLMKQCADNLFAIDRLSYQKDYEHLSEQHQLLKNVDQLRNMTDPLQKLMMQCVGHLSAIDRTSYQKDYDYLSEQYKQYKDATEKREQYKPALQWLAQINNAVDKLKAQEKKLSLDSSDIGMKKYTLVKQMTTQIENILQKNNFNFLKNPQELQRSLLDVCRNAENHADYSTLAKHRSWGKAYATFKNILLFVLPVFGWTVGAYRAWHGSGFYDRRPRTERYVEDVKNAISSVLPKKHK